MMDPFKASLPKPTTFGGRRVTHHTAEERRASLLFMIEIIEIFDI
jgi:hypothetical protein